MAHKTMQVSDRWRELCNRAWTDIFEATAQKYADMEAIIFDDRRITYKEYSNAVDQLARGLYAIGVRRGDHVALWMTNRPEWGYCRFAIYKLGAVMVPLNTRYKHEDLQYVLSHSDSRVLIMEDSFLGKIDAAGMFAEMCPEIQGSGAGQLTLEKFPLLRSVICFGNKPKAGFFSPEEVIELGKRVVDIDIRPELRSDDTAHIIYTSGTTGFPKGVVTPNSNSIAHMTIATELYGLNEGDRFLNVMPFFGNIGLGNQSFPILAGATLVTTNRTSPEDILILIERERVSSMILVPTLLIDLLAYPAIKRFDVSSLKSLACGGAFVPEPMIEGVRQNFGIDVMNAYGLVEASGLSCWVSQGETTEHVQSTVGYAMPHCKVTIRDPVTNEELPPGTEGEICSAEVFPGSQFMKGYYKNPELTAQTIRGGWLHSGDLGRMDEDGYVKITGRVKEMFTVGGFNVSPPEVETCLLKHPKVESVAVVGVPDQRLGEVGAAYIRITAGQAAKEEEIVEYCKGRIANFKVPRYVFFVDEFPLNPQGKVQKFKLREQFVKNFGEAHV